MAAFTLCAGATALADPTDPSIPSQEQVDAAKAQVGDAATRVSAINATLDAADQRLRVSQSAAGMAAERYNAAVLELTRRTAAAEAAKTAAATARGQADDAQLTVDDLAAQIYMSGGSLDGMEVLLSATGPDDVAARAAGLDIMTTYRHAVLTDAAVAARRAAEADRIAASAQLQQRAAAEQAKSLADAARAAAEAAAQERAKVAGQQATLIAELATLKNTSAALETQRREGLAAAAARKAAEERAAAEAARIAAEKAAAAKAAAEKAAAEKAAAEKAAAEKAARDKANSGSGNSGSGNSGSGGSGSDSATTDTGSQAPPAPKGGVAAVIAFARAQLGKPYEWGGSGPYAWDCSGLTQAAWRQAGVSIDHYTGSQWAQTSRVPLSQLQPGDLVFYGTAPYNIHHVGLYIGGGQMIHAPTFGVPVQIASIYWDDLIPYGGRP